MREAKGGAAEADQKSKKTSGTNKKARKFMYHGYKCRPSPKEDNVGLFRYLQ